MDTPEYVGKTFVLTGDELVGTKEIADLYTQVFGFEVAPKTIGVDEWVEKYIGRVRAAHRDHEAAHLENLGRLTTGHMYEHTTGDLDALLGHEPKGLLYAMEHNGRVLEVKKLLEGRA